MSNTNPWTYAGPVPLTPNPEHDLDNGFALYAVNDMSGTVGFLTLARMVGVPVHTLAQHRIDFRELRVDGITSLTLNSREPLKWQLDGEFGGEETELRLKFVPHAIDVISPEPS
ncbi:hypothetical protein QVA66_06500 [Staphylococcus chromogenes]|nr:hypothetical protein [Staphylococcus chromogenes]